MRATNQTTVNRHQVATPLRPRASGAVALGGMALHAGVHTSVVLVRRPGPIAFCQHGYEACLDELRVARVDRGVAVQDQVIFVDLCEHLLSAVGGLGIDSGLRIDVFGCELPLLDGGAFRFARCLRQLGWTSQSRRRRIVKEAEIEVANSLYRFRPGPGVYLSVEVVFEHELIATTHACWHGDADDYLKRIAPARTFGFRREAEQLMVAGRARGIDFRSVVVLEDDGTSLSSPPPVKDECVRHKLLDLIGDLTLDGGVPEGIIEAYRPGHGATHAALDMAKVEGVFEAMG
ncbi:MAG: hypothetical protein CSA75_01460 [Sorangium cellulosum]|nr:MAG: hypothetical protein CSA75_01460 [Sorangium cellulosum]